MSGAADNLRMAARSTGVLVDDPFSVMVEVLADAVFQVTQGQEALVASADDLLDRLASVLAVGRETAEAEANRFRVELAASEVDVVRRVGRAIAEAADGGLARRGQALDRRTGFVAALALIAVSAGAGFAGWQVGHEAGRGEVGVVAADVQGVFRQGAEVANAWRDLINWNDLRSALQACGKPGEIIMQDGRRACRVPLWLSRPTLPLP